MTDIIALLLCLDQSLDRTTLRQLNRIVLAILAMTGRVTMLGISRWAGKGGSYRTIQRFFNKVLPWGQMTWLFFRTHLFRREEVYLLVGDETVVTKAGKATYGLGRFFSSIYNRSVRGLSFFTLSLVSVNEGHSYPMAVEQIVPEKETRSEASPQGKKKKKKKKGGSQAATEPKRKAGRPKGSKNKDKTQIEWTPELRRLERMATTLLGRIDGLFSITYVVLDGHFGNNNVLQVVRQQLKMHLISKLRHDSALYFQYEGPQKKYGPRRRYGEKINYQAIPDKYRVSRTTEKNIRTDIYQATMLHKSFAQPLNVVIIVKTNLETGAWAHVVLFSSDLSLSYELIIQYYQLRFQIEFNFRDAKQFWGLEDFMNVKQVPVTNAVNLSFFMVNVSYRLLQDLRRFQADAGVLDLKTFFRGRRYAQVAIEMLPQPPTPNFIKRVIQRIACLGAIHTTPDSLPLT